MRNRLDLADLHLFVHVAEALSLTRAAELSGMSLASASNRVRQLEEQLGTKLLYRRTHGVSLTAAGDALLLHARRVLRQLDHLQMDLRDFAVGLRGHVRLYANTTSISGDLPEALGLFLTQNPTVTIDLKEHLSADVVLALKQARADLGIVAGEIDTEGLAVHEFGHDDLVLAVPKTHRLTARKQVSFADTLEEYHVTLSQSSALAGFISAQAQQLGADLQFRLQMASFDSILRMIEAGVGVGVVPRSAAARYGRRGLFAVVDLCDSWAIRELKIVAKEAYNLPRSAKYLLDFLVQWPQTHRRRARYLQALWIGH
ncbi:MAG: LysR family transcriptional regulator [Betaproteobacteria bacterium]|nr:LysR family transcriptional regulator [Betaproteobacteria bacterium]